MSQSAAVESTPVQLVRLGSIGDGIVFTAVTFAENGFQGTLYTLNDERWYERCDRCEGVGALGDGDARRRCRQCGGYGVWHQMLPATIPIWLATR